MSEGLTKLQSRALDFITESITQRGLSPTIEEIRVANRSIVLVPDRRAGHVLAPDLQAKLERHCNKYGERPGDVVADAVALHLDALEAAPPVEGAA